MEVFLWHAKDVLPPHLRAYAAKRSIAGVAQVREFAVRQLLLSIQDMFVVEIAICAVLVLPVTPLKPFSSGTFVIHDIRTEGT